jgi:GMP synthase-like glutamine amidotransferase
MTILIVDMNYKEDSLAYFEFVKPILSVLEPLEPCKVKHYSELKPTEPQRYSHIILSGTTLKDFEFLNHPKKFSWLQTCTKPVLGICAGMQTILKIYGEALTGCLQVGMTQITTTKSNQLFGGVFQAYSLHSYTTSSGSENFEIIAKSKECPQAIKHKQKPIYGLLFHPEVRNPDILKRFAKL